MSKKWMVNAPNGNFVNIDGVGRMNHGDETVNEKLAGRFPHIFIEVFTQAGPTLMEEPAPVAEIINEKPPVEEVIEDSQPAPVIDEAPVEEPVIEEAKPKKKAGRKSKKK